MPCYHPLPGYMAPWIDATTGEHRTAWKFCRSKKLLDPVPVPCGRCVGCQLERSRDWAVRCMHEAQMHPENSFLTLTYSDKYLPRDGSLRHTHFQNFMKAVRPRWSNQLRYFMCGEYGEQLGRPHYHVCLFGADAPDKRFYKNSHGGPLFKSEVLNELWGRGDVIVAALTFATAAYCARYTLEKVRGARASSHYGNRMPEYVRMSRSSGLGKSWLTSFKSDVYPRDEVIVHGQRQKPPKFYDKQLPENEIASLKEERRSYAKKSPDNTPARLEARERVKLAAIKQLKRNAI